MIVINNLAFEYKKNTPIFDNLNLTINSKFFGLIGINGAGKTTLLNLSLGFLKPSEGTIKVNSYDVSTQLVDVLRQIGIVHQNPKFPSWTRIGEYLQWVGRLRGLTPETSRQQSLFLLNKLDLAGRESERVSNLSAGLVQRFAIAQAVIGIPKIIFLDEPTSNLDVHSRYEILNFLKHLSDEYDCQIIIMSHILADLERYCEEIAIIHKGEIEYQELISQILVNVKFKSFIIRGNLSDEIIQRLERKEIKLLSSSANEVIVEFNGDIEELQELLPKNIVIAPQRSKLEELFLSVTGLSDGVISNEEFI